MTRPRKRLTQAIVRIRAVRRSVIGFRHNSYGHGYSNALLDVLIQLEGDVQPSRWREDPSCWAELRTYDPARVLAGADELGGVMEAGHDMSVTDPALRRDIIEQTGYEPGIVERKRDSGEL